MASKNFIDMRFPQSSKKDLMPRKNIIPTAAIIIFATVLALASVVSAGGKKHGQKGRGKSVQLGQRPFYLVEDMDASQLKTELEHCSEGPFKKTDFSIGHRGAAKGPRAGACSSNDDDDDD
jgi:hypothetical protein